MRCLWIFATGMRLYITIQCCFFPISCSSYHRMDDGSMKCEYVCVCLCMYVSFCTVILYLSMFLSINKLCNWYGVAIWMTNSYNIWSINLLIFSSNRQVGVQFADYVANEQYSEALSVAQTSLQTLKQLQNQTLYTAGVELIESEIQKALKIKQNG